MLNELDALELLRFRQLLVVERTVHRHVVGVLVVHELEVGVELLVVGALQSIEVVMGILVELDNVLSGHSVLGQVVRRGKVTKACNK